MESTDAMTAFATERDPSSVNICGNNNRIYINSPTINTLNKQSNNLHLNGSNAGHADSGMNRCDSDRLTAPNADLADNEMNGSIGNRLKEIWEETSRKYVPFFPDDFFLPILPRELLKKKMNERVKKQDVRWTTNKFVGGVHSDVRDNLYEHFEVQDDDVEDIRSKLRKEESVADEVYKVLNHGLRVRVQRTRGYLLGKLYERDENLARGFIEYLFEEIVNEIKRNAGRNDAEASSQFSPPARTQNAIKYQTSNT